MKGMLMMKQIDQTSCRRQRGIALLIVCFALLLLSVIGLGMMYSTNMETTINSNYRDKQIALYAALAGLQEARERLKYPYNYNITPPTQLPSTSAANVLYIVANSAIRPWDPTSTKYFDTELCQQNVLGLSGTAGVPCTTIASGTSWLQSFDDSQSASAPWNLYPLDFKWARIELKGNNMTPVPVNGDSTDSSQACWNGVNQMSTPTTYTTGCKPIGGVTAVSVLTSGSRYTSTPTVTITGGGGTGATATAYMLPEQTGHVISIAVTTGGSSYTSPPAVTITDAAGTGAAATAVLSSVGVSTIDPGIVSAISMTTGGAGYTTPPLVTISGGGGVGATGVAVLSSVGVPSTTGHVSSVTMTTGGTAYTSPPTVSFAGGGGSNAAGTAVLSPLGGVQSIAVNSVGTQCYSQPSDVVVSITGGGGVDAAATATLETTRSCIYSVTVTSSPQCSGKLMLPTYNPKDQMAGLTFEDVGNKSFSGTLYVSSSNDKTPTSISIQNPGYDTAGYGTATFNSQLQLSTGAWADCGNITAVATTGYRLASLNVTSPGSGYLSAPTVTISGGSGTTSNPTAVATLGFPVASVTITDGGSGYTSAPTVSFTGGGGSGAAATDTIALAATTTYPVASVTITAGGTGYTTAPTISFTGGGGSGAAAVAAIAQTTLTTYPVVSVTVTSGGSGYSVAAPPAISFTGGGGTGAVAVATVSNTNSGTYYVDHIDVDTQGSGYSSNPTVTLSGGAPVTAATAVAQVSGGTKFGKVYLLTSFAQTKTGARSMLQQEVASPVLGFAPGGPITLDGPNPNIDAMPNSVNFYVHGNDANSCSEPPEADHPAIDGYDDPNANPPTSSVQSITNSLPRPDHYLGAGGTPSVQNGYGTLGDTMTTPTGLSALMGAIYNQAPPSSRYTNANVGSFNPATTNRQSITYVDGDLTLSGNGTGYGILVVTGTLTMSGNFTWFGTVFVVGDGNMQFNGGGNGAIVGMLWDAKIWDNRTNKNLLNTLGSPTFGWNGGGVNSVQYDHCWVTDLMSAIPFNAPASTKPLKVLSFRILPY
jgi:hypothetical protein